MSIEEYDDNEDFEEAEAPPDSWPGLIFLQVKRILVGGVYLLGVITIPAGLMGGPQMSGANTQSFLGNDGKPILMELRNCRIVEQQDSGSAPTSTSVSASRRSGQVFR